MTETKDRRDPETIKQMDTGRAFIGGIPQRKTPVKQSDFRHTHEWGETPDGKRVCKGCGVIA